MGFWYWLRRLVQAVRWLLGIVGEVQAASADSQESEGKVQAQPGRVNSAEERNPMEQWRNKDK